MQDFHDEAGNQQFGGFHTDDLPSVFNKAASPASRLS
jgi:hypothetical protein